MISKCFCNWWRHTYRGKISSHEKIHSRESEEFFAKKFTGNLSGNVICLWLRSRVKYVRMNFTCPKLIFTWNSHVMDLLVSSLCFTLFSFLFFFCLCRPDTNYPQRLLIQYCNNNIHWLLHTCQVYRFLGYSVVYPFFVSSIYIPTNWYQHYSKILNPN